MRVIILWALMLVAVAKPAAAADINVNIDGFYICKTTYALCTMATCGQDGTCKCIVMTGYSAGQKDCVPVSGATISSRFFPMASFQACGVAPTQQRPWTNCLDKSCQIDSSNPAAATCTCTNESGSGSQYVPWVIATQQPAANMCPLSSGQWTVYSSAAVADSNKIFKAFNKFVQTYGSQIESLFVPAQLP
ncbi:MAG TPA: hypothetical protein VM782_15835 [Stellaceae bacterium]|nr:hypothetical protein [Stellaceae bacterium]